MGTGMKKFVFKQQEILQTAFKKHLLLFVRLFLYLWKVQGASTHLKVVSATKQSLHRAVAGTLGICASTEYKWSQSLLSPHRDGGQLSVTHSWWQIALPGSCLSAQQSTAEDKQGHLPTPLLLSRRVPMPSIKTIIGRDFLTAQQVVSRTRERASSTRHSANPKPSSPNRVIYFKPCQPRCAITTSIINLIWREMTSTNQYLL